MVCDETHHPVSLSQPMDGNSIQTERFRTQLSASVVLHKQLWQQTVQAKISNQGVLLARRRRNPATLTYLARNVRSGDEGNLEAQAAAHYWKQLFEPEAQFTRAREGPWPNNLLNYGYAVLRALTARCVVATGLLPALGIHHHNRYNAFCLADDLMEPYRPFVDELVLELMATEPQADYLSRPAREHLLQVIYRDVRFRQEKSVLAVAVMQTTQSLCRCFDGKSKRLEFAEFC